jgi:hypothetical protein
LLTEAFAFHDRRTEDTDKETPSSGQAGTTAIDTATNMRKDEDFDQRLKPRGSLFVELYNPWSGAYAPRNSECYRDVGMDPQPNTNQDFKDGVVLAKVSDDDGTADRHGVWRLLIVKEPNTAVTPPAIGRDPDDPVASNRPTAYVERSVYFCFSQNVPGDPNHGVAYCPGGNMSLASVLLPGRYAVVGGYHRSDGQFPTKKYFTTIGRHNNVTKYPGTVTDLMLTSTRRIEFNPRPQEYPLVTNQVSILNNESITPTPPATGDIQPAVAVVIDALSSSASNDVVNLNVS